MFANYVMTTSMKAPNPMGAKCKEWHSVMLPILNAWNAIKYNNLVWNVLTLNVKYHLEDMLVSSVNFFKTGLPKLMISFTVYPNFNIGLM